MSLDTTKPFAVVIDDPNGLLSFLVEGKENDPEPCRFATREEAVAATKGAMWEHAWVWYVVELAEDGRVGLWAG